VLYKNFLSVPVLTVHILRRPTFRTQKITDGACRKSLCGARQTPGTSAGAVTVTVGSVYAHGGAKPHSGTATLTDRDGTVPHPWGWEQGLGHRDPDRRSRVGCQPPGVG
jgi:hypothetical protein